MTIHDYFDRLVVINLPERTDRRAAMVEELTRVGIYPSPKVAFLDAIKPNDGGTFVSRGTHGCFLSHLSALKDARDRGLKSVLVMEDDLTFSPRYRVDEERLVAELQREAWGIVFLGNLLHPLLDEPNRLEPLSGPLVGCHFYAVHAAAFEELIDYLTLVAERPAGHPDGGGVPVDGAISMFRERHPEVRALIALPNLGGQRSTRSDITPRWFDRVPVVRSVIELARRAKRALRRK
jgi:glycosyl transferase family 25